MVFVKVRETYDLHTVKNKMTVIAIHTPKPEIIKMNYPGLLMQCKAYRPVSCDVKIACASVLPLDPKGVGLADGDVAPEDVFNPILYKAMSNKGMSQVEARINSIVRNPVGVDVIGQQAMADVDTFSAASDEFDVYYGFLSNTRGWKHAHPQNGLMMKGLKPYVYDMVYNVGDMSAPYVSSEPTQTTPKYESFGAPNDTGIAANVAVQSILGKVKPMPFLPCTSYDSASGNTGTNPGFPVGLNAERTVPYIPVVCGGIIIPPSRLHELFYRMVVEWTIEFSKIRPLVEIADFYNGIGYIGYNTHFKNYSYEATKEAITGDSDTILESDSCMVSSNVDVEKVM